MSFALSFIGAGNLAEAILRGVLDNRLCPPQRIIAADVSPARREVFAKMGVNVVEGAAHAADAAVVLLCVKPQQMEAALAELAPVLDPAALVISNAAAITTRFIAQSLGGSRRIVRAMANTPLLVGAGMVAIARGPGADESAMAEARRIFEPAATVTEVTEDKLDAVTAVSGSGPAYFFYLVEQMVKAGVELGLTPQEAHTLATRTAAGAAKMLIESTDSPQELRRKVTSPGGTTQAAIETMEKGGVADAVIAAVKRAAARAGELGR